MKKYRVKNKENFIITIGALIILIIMGTYLTLHSETNTCEATETKIVSKKIVTEDVVQESEVVEMPIYNIILSKELQNFTYNECLFLDVSYELELSILKSESEFNEKAVSYTGICMGIGQLNPTTAKGLAKSLQIDNFDIFNAKHNICCSIYLIKQFSDYWRSEGYNEEDAVRLSLLSYNRGLYGCKKYIRNYSIYNDNYVNKILQRKSDLEQYGQFIN